MMPSGRSIPYQLRQNKAVDRYAFLELLSKIDKFSDISTYTYVGFGGYSLEDFKYIHAQFGNEKMISIEQDEEVYKRQKFNQPHSCISRFLLGSGEFIDEFPDLEDFSEDGKSIFWLDYVRPKDLKVQVEEFQALLSKLNHLDIVKITLNAHPSSYVDIPQDKKAEERNEIRLNTLREMLGNDLFPTLQISSDMMVEREFPNALCKVLEMASEIAVRARPRLSVHPLTTFSYADGQQMLTVTAILLDELEADSFLEKTGICDWDLYQANWSNPRQIDIPNLTVRERLLIDSLLPDATSNDIQKRLGFRFDKKNSKSLRMLENYALFYRQSPFFSRVVV